MFKKRRVGYEKKEVKKQKPKNKNNHWVTTLFLAKPKQVSFIEKIIKFLIYIVLRMVIKPSKWKISKDKNYEMIDRIYKKIVSTDFVYIPSSISFHMMMAFLPLITLLLSFTFFIPHTILPEGQELKITFDSSIGDIIHHGFRETLGKFIPGVNGIMDQIQGALFSKNTIFQTDTKGIVGAIALGITFLTSLWISASGFSKIVFTQSHIFKHRFYGGYWMNKFKGMFIGLLFVLFLILGLFLNIIITFFINIDQNILLIYKDVLIYVILIITLVVGLFGLVLLLFKYSPRFKIKFRHLIPGALIVAIPSSIFLTFFGTIASSLGTYGSYGTVGVVMYIGLSSLFITYFLFVGIVTNASYYKTFVSENVMSKWTISKK